MEEIVKSLKASVTSLKSANTKYRNEIENLKAYAKEADELNKHNVEKIHMLTKELQKTKSELQNLKESVISSVVDELNKTKQERDEAIDALEKAKKPWWKKIF